MCARRRQEDSGTAAFVVPVIASMDRSFGMLEERVKLSGVAKAVIERSSEAVPDRFLGRYHPLRPVSLTGTTGLSLIVASASGLVHRLVIRSERVVAKRVSPDGRRCATLHYIASNVSYVIPIHRCCGTESRTGEQTTNAAGCPSEILKVAVRIGLSYVNGVTLKPLGGEH